MLPAAHRMRSSEEFRRTIRAGVRSGSPSLVLHAHRSGADAPTQVGFVVSRAVGDAVTRNRVRRRLRHLVAVRLGVLPSGLRLVVRALPVSATDPRRLVPDLEHGLERLRSRLGPEQR